MEFIEGMLVQKVEIDSDTSSKSINFSVVAPGLHPKLFGKAICDLVTHQPTVERNCTI